MDFLLQVRLDGEVESEEQERDQREPLRRKDKLSSTLGPTTTRQQPLEEPILLQELLHQLLAKREPSTPSRREAVREERRTSSR